MKTSFWKQDWFYGLLAVLAVLLASPVTDKLENDAYDFGVRSSSREASDNIAIIAIDETSLENLGRWPWSRDIHAEMIDRLSGAGAKVIAYTPVFSEAQIDPGLDYIGDILTYYKETHISSLTLDTAPTATSEASEDNTNENSEIAAPAKPRNRFEHLAGLLTGVGDEVLQERLQNSLNNIQRPVAEIEVALHQAYNNLDADRKLISSFANAANVVTPMWLLWGEPFGNPDQALPEFVQKTAITNIEDNVGAELEGYSSLPPETVQAITPLNDIGLAASGLGNINNWLDDTDGGIRTSALVSNYFGEYFPSYALMIAARSLNLTVDDITAQLGEGVKLGRLSIDTDAQLKMLTFFYQGESGERAFPIDSFFDVTSNKVPASKYRDKIVIVGPTASGIGQPQLTPIDPIMSEAESLAHAVSSILNEDFFTVPSWAQYAELAAILLILLFVIFLLPRLNAKMGAIISSALLLALFITHYILMTTQATWVQLMLPATILAFGYLVLTTKRFLVTERSKLHSDMESAESNKMLGLAFQGQGQLDMAFEKFRKCPKDDGISEVLYNLALDFERKRQFAKAGNVYQYIAEFNPKFRDVEQRIARSKKMEDTIVLGGSGGSTTAGTLIMEGDGAVEKPMLGRYQVEKELGKGAMGVVYLGKDPKISRVVAIKTMALSQEFDEDELEDVKERFFREAETAGRLNHPNIVTIYDAGEEHDLAFIAMEFLKGKDLAPYTKPDNLLPLKTVLELMISSAEALDYAHQQNVVHRDIKPANIMYDPESGQVKITDFGIARITDSSKTKTGMVLGTPSYMSPEQLAGKKVDGRSDLFSLGVMLFQMASGQLPFKADSMASLMFKITNDPHPSVLEVKPDLPPYLEVIIAKTLEKDAADRYQRGTEIASDLKKCLQQL